jgi:D-beta-D-heptose 7-phosphate kinase/D-beta-D-heptose 1-phosphate adenosyltransferase
MSRAEIFETVPRARLARRVNAFRGRRLGVVGDFMLDRYVLGTATRLSPEAAVPVVDFVGESDCLGGAGNVAANLAALGARVACFGIAGADGAAENLRELLRDIGISDREILADPLRETTLKTRIIARQQQVVRVDRETRDPLPAALEEKLIRQIIAGLRKLDALVVSDYDKGVVSEELAARVLGACGKLGIPAFVKPKWSMLATYSGATAIVLNRAEAGFLVTRSLSDEESIRAAGAQLLEKFKCPAVILTRGQQGLSVFEHDRPGGFLIPATSLDLPFGPGVDRRQAARGPGRQVFDVTGAGDTVLATLALAVAAGATMVEAALLGNVAAGVVVSKLGTATVSPAELLSAVRDAG